MRHIIGILLEKRTFVIIILLLIAIFGSLAYHHLKIDVFPDPSPVLVQIFTEVEGVAPSEVEKFVSYPIETSLYGLPGVNRITSLSTFGLSAVNVYFDDGVDIHFARQLVSQELPALAAKLPEFAEAPSLGPISTGLGMVYIYRLEGDLPAIELRSIQDWLIKFQLKTVPGVAGVLTEGGDYKQFQVAVNPDLLRKYSLELSEVIKAVEQSSQNITAGYIVRNKEESLVRGLALFEEKSDLENVVIKEVGGTPLFLKDIAAIGFGPAVRRGNAIYNKESSTVSGIVMKLIGVNTADLIKRLDKKIAQINAGLPEGILLVPVYNQALIIKAAFHTVSEALFLGIVLVALILFIFVNDLRSTLVSSLSIPFSVFVTFMVMQLTDMTADLMSFGGLAIGIGLLVDATVVVVENISRNRDLHPNIKDSKIVLDSLMEVLRPLTYAMVMIILSFIPLLTLTGVEGKMFKPFGFTLLTAITAAIVYAIFISPVMMNMVGKRKKTSSSSVFEAIKTLYLKLFDFTYARANTVLAVFIVIFLISLVLANQLGSEFIPRLNEETLQLETLLPQNTSLEETENTVRKIQGLLLEIPEVVDAYGRIGTGEAGSHVHPVNNAHTIINLKKKKFWQAKSDQALILKIEQLVKKNIPGVILNFTHPIKHNLDHLITGVRADLAIKIYGSDYDELTALAEEVKQIMTTVSGAGDVQISTVSGQNEIAVKLDRKKIARYGLKPAEVLAELEAAFGGKSIAKVYQGDIVYDVFIRYDQLFRKNIEDLDRFLLDAGSDRQIPLKAVADISESAGLSNIIREDGKRYIAVQCNVRSGDIGSMVAESKKKIYQQIKLPLGYYLDWGGQFELKEKAEKRLYLVLLITLVLILILLFDFLKSWKDIFIVMINLPVSLSGGLISLWIAGANLSVPSTIGFIALLGIALENTLVLITFLQRNTADSVNFDQAVRESVALRLRPILMTKFTTIIGLIPLLFSSGIGSEIQKPLAIVVIGGIFFSIFTTLLLMPIVYKKIRFTQLQKH